MTDLNPYLKNSFDPFENRMCRDIRNDLSESLIETLRIGDISPSLKIAETYLNQAHGPIISHYIVSRIRCYQVALSRIQLYGVRDNDTFRIMVILWNQELFFEVHEWLETKWHNSEGIEKETIQTLIRAAGTYVHLQLGRMHSARKIGAKALAGLIKNKSCIPDIINAGLLIEKIKTLDPTPPKL